MLSLESFKSKLFGAGTVKWKPSYDLEQFWCFDVKGSPEEVWTYISDTSRFNRELGFAPREKKEIDGKAEITTVMLGFEQIWIEEPWTWLYPKTISANRIYKKGMAEAVHAVFHIEPGANGVCQVYIYFGWDVKSIIWKSVLSLSESVIKSKFFKTFKKIENFLREHRHDYSGAALSAAAKTLSEPQQKRLEDLLSDLVKKTGESEVAKKLGQLILSGDDFELESIRVLKLANDWGIDSKKVLTTCLHATRTGLLNISWNVVCPHCRGPRFSAETLGDIPEGSACGSCAIEFTTSEPDIIEVVFRINKAVRDVPEVMYCAAEPAKKAHIKVHQRLLSGEKFSFAADLKNGYYRARVLNSPDSYVLQIRDGASGEPLTLFLGSQNPGLQKTGSGTKSGEILEVARGTVISLQNKNSEPMVFTFEELQWNDFILRPSKVFLIPEFRDLFSSEHLNSNVKLHLGEQTILFTDIVGSTKFYEKVGDAKAFSEVRAHFQEVFSEVKNHDGAVVKTIGDAVMAAFPSLEEAFGAATAIQKRFHADRSDLSIRVRISLHRGIVIAVQLNTGIDYFGSVVNSGAKIQSLAGAGEIAMAARLCDELKQKLGSRYLFPEVEKPQSEQSFGFPVRVITVT
jgi:class 3 adenylate cyclase